MLHERHLVFLRESHIAVLVCGEEERSFYYLFSVDAPLFGVMEQGSRLNLGGSMLLISISLVIRGYGLWCPVCVGLVGLSGIGGTRSLGGAQVTLGMELS